MSLPRRPSIYQINTYVWLFELSRQYGRSVTLGDVPPAEWDTVAARRTDAVWLMGVWERSPASIAVSLNDPGLLEDFRRTLPDFSEADDVGSGYCVRNYVVDAHLGGPEGLTAARRELTARGRCLILDFVPNHVAHDHPWVTAHPEYFIQGDEQDLQRDPRGFFEVGGKVIACGRDPYFPAWSDVAQLNAFSPALRQAHIETLSRIADQCDGVRCDMAMLLIGDVIERTWGAHAGARPGTEYWPEVIGAVRRHQPGFTFIAEAYWDLEWTLQQQGFDYCYDKRLYDRLAHEDANSVRLHLVADPGYQEKLIRFTENHDEPRAAATFEPARERAAAIVSSSLPGAKLFHDGQFEGRRVHVPVILRRRPEEPVDAALADFYAKLLELVADSVLHTGEWRLFKCTGWPDNQSCQNLIAYGYHADDQYRVIVVNYSGAGAQGQVQWPWPELAGHTLTLTDALHQQSYTRSGDPLISEGLYIDLPAWGAHWFHPSSLTPGAAEGRGAIRLFPPI